MIVLDTNVLVRYLTHDEPAAAKRAAILLGDPGGVFIPKTVVLELEWVLRAAYRIHRDGIAKGIRQLGGLPRVRLEGAAEVAQAIDWMLLGFDFADALHRLSSPADAPLFTFDRRFVLAAASVGARVEDAWDPKG